MSVYISEICKIPKCDKPSVAEGYCAFHYNIEKQKEVSKSQSKMVSLLTDMNARLNNIEQQLQTSRINVPNFSHSYQSVDTPKKTEEKKSKSERKTSTFIPIISSLNAETTIKDVKKCQTSKNVRNLAHRLNITSQEE